MFQEPRLLPWARVLSNVEVGLGRERKLQAAPQARLRDAAPKSGSKRPAQRMAGGALRAARSSAWRWPARLVSRPRVLALDEPLGALDALTRIEMQDCWSASGSTRASPRSW
jgi:sulfonate transport system ATP-binding protein